MPDSPHAGFFQSKLGNVVTSPNGRPWWHHMPMPDGSRVRGANQDPDYQYKMWEALQIPPANGLAGKSILDIGANDGFFTLAALKAGAASATAVNSDDWSTYPHNIQFASEAWGLKPEILTADFRSHDFGRAFDVILFLGVLYHLEDVFTCMKILRSLLNPGGVLYIETQMTMIQCDLPIFEYASDIYPTQVIQYKQALNQAGISNYLFPNLHAMRNLAHSYDFAYEHLTTPPDQSTQQAPDRQYFKFTKLEA
jgi:2-polyprenyl-3-methyl-5-hydroxy-6-metoxy-1,4-benzoquinol methylase